MALKDTLLKEIIALPPLSKLDTIRNLFKVVVACFVAFLVGLFVMGWHRGYNTMQIRVGDIISALFTYFLVYFTLVQTQIDERNQLSHEKQLRLDYLRNALENFYGFFKYLLHDENRINIEVGGYRLSERDRELLNQKFTKFSYVIPPDIYTQWHEEIRVLERIPHHETESYVIWIPLDFRKDILDQYDSIKEEYDALTSSHESPG